MIRVELITVLLSAQHHIMYSPRSAVSPQQESYFFTFDSVWALLLLDGPLNNFLVDVLYRSTGVVSFLMSELDWAEHSPLGSAASSSGQRIIQLVTLLCMEPISVPGRLRTEEGGENNTLSEFIQRVACCWLVSHSSCCEKLGLLICLLHLRR